MRKILRILMFAFCFVTACYMAVDSQEMSMLAAALVIFHTAAQSAIGDDED